MFRLLKRHKGFTLIELMVAISIVAILATIGLTLFSNAQKTGRDGKRRGDIDAITTNLESRFNTTTDQNCTGAAGNYCPPLGTWFAGGSVPVDPLNSGAYTYTNSGAVLPVAIFTTYTICAHLETAGSGNAYGVNAEQTGTSKDWYCKKNQQQ